MTELMRPTIDKLRDPNRLIMGEELAIVYQRKLGALTLPETFYYTDDIDVSNVLVIGGGPDPAIQDVRQAFIEQTAQFARDASWWTQLGEILRQLDASDQSKESMQVKAKHIFTTHYDGNPVDQGFEVFEVGDKTQGMEVIESVAAALHVADQYSGGLLAAHTDRPRIILLDGVRLRSNDGAGETCGVTFGQTVVLNLRTIRDISRTAGADCHDVLSGITIHEVLGHALENIRCGRTGRYFKDHFMYSEIRTKGDIFSSIHTSIEPIDSTRVGTRPVREYGWRSPAEDLATSVDALVCSVMDWSSETDKIPRFKSTLDAYRTELVLTFMDQTADAASMYAYTPGYAGSEVRYEPVGDGGLAPKQRRTLSFSSRYDEGIMCREIDKVVQAYDPGKSFIVFSCDIL